MRSIKVTPIYGWGWFLSGAPSARVPSPFTIADVKNLNGAKAWAGVVQEPGHEFDGLRVRLSQRHVVWDGDVNVTVEDDSEKSSNGFAMVDLSLAGSPD